MFAQRLVELRKQKKTTQQDVADKLKITRPAYTAYERGNREPDYVTLQKLADYFEVTTDYLLGRVDDPNDIMNVAYSRGGHNFTKEEKEYLESVMEDEIEKFLRIRKQFLKDKENDKE